MVYHKDDAGGSAVRGMSYIQKRFDIRVWANGKITVLNPSLIIVIVNLQEIFSDAKHIASSIIRKETFVLIPTPEPTYISADITINKRLADSIDITPGLTVPETAAVRTRKGM